MTINQLIERIEELDAAATKGPWARVSHNLNAPNEPCTDSHIASNGRGGTNQEWIERGNINLDFSAAARTLLPACAKLLRIICGFANDGLPESMLNRMHDEISDELSKLEAP